MSKIKNTPYEDRALNQSYYTYDALYGPWNSFKEMVESVQETTVPDSYLNNFLKNTVPIGLTVGIIEDNKVVEYWNPVRGQGFVKKYDFKNSDTTNTYMIGDDDSDTEEFLTVTGVNIGGLSTGDVITNGTSLEDLLKKVLQKEIDVTGVPPTVILNYAPSQSIYEVGTEVKGTMSYTFNKGYFVGASSEYQTKQYADCAVSSVTYNPSENYDVIISEGSNTFSVTIGYTSSNVNGNKPLTNLNNESSVVIPAGTCSDKEIVTGSYKIWYGNIPIKYTSGLTIRDTKTWCSNDVDSFVKYAQTVLTQGWTNENKEVALGSGDNSTVTNNMYQNYYLICPVKYILYGKQFDNTVSVIYNSDNIYTYTLENGKTVSYAVYAWTEVNQTYKEVKMILK